MSARTCGCKPGTEESGWQEERSVECLREESEAFEAAIVRAIRERWCDTTWEIQL